MNPFNMIANVLAFAVTQIINRVILWFAVAFVFFIFTPGALPDFAYAVWMIFIGGDGPFALFGLAKWIYGFMAIVYIILSIWYAMIIAKACAASDPPPPPKQKPVTKRDIKAARKQAVAKVMGSKV